MHTSYKVMLTIPLAVAWLSLCIYAGMLAGDGIESSSVGKVVLSIFVLACGLCIGYYPAKHIWK